MAALALIVNLTVSETESPLAMNMSPAHRLWIRRIRRVLAKHCPGLLIFEENRSGGQTGAHDLFQIRIRSIIGLCIAISSPPQSLTHSLGRGVIVSTPLAPFTQQLA
jgi:hypothetical protein